MSTEDSRRSAQAARAILQNFRQIMGPSLFWEGRGLEERLAERSGLSLKEAEGWLGQFVRWGIIRRVSRDESRGWRLEYPAARFSVDRDRIQVDYGPPATGRRE